MHGLTIFLHVNDALAVWQGLFYVGLTGDAICKVIVYGLAYVCGAYRFLIKKQLVFDEKLGRFRFKSGRVTT